MRSTAEHSAESQELRGLQHRVIHSLNHFTSPSRLTELVVVSKGVEVVVVQLEEAHGADVVVGVRQFGYVQGLDGVVTVVVWQYGATQGWTVVVGVVQYGGRQGGVVVGVRQNGGRHGETVVVVRRFSAERALVKEILKPEPSSSGSQATVTTEALLRG